MEIIAYKLYVKRMVFTKSIYKSIAVNLPYAGHKSGGRNGSGGNVASILTSLLDVLYCGYVGLRIASKSCRTGVPLALTITPYRSLGTGARICFTADPFSNRCSPFLLKLSILSMRIILGLWFQDSLNSCRVRSFGSDEWRCL